MNKDPKASDTSSYFSGFVKNLTIAGVVGTVIFATLLLHDLIVFGHVVQSVGMYLVYGGATFLGVMVITTLPTKLAVYAIPVLVLAVALLIPMDNLQVKNVKDAADMLGAPAVVEPVQPDVVSPPASVAPEVAPPAVVEPEASVVVQPDATVVAPEPVSPAEIPQSN